MAKFLKEFTKEESPKDDKCMEEYRKEDSEKQIKKKKKAKIRNREKARVIKSDSLEEQNKKMKKRTPVRKERSHKTFLK